MLQNYQAFYEHERDNQVYPSCWRRPDNFCHPHFHSSLELVYVTSGEMKAVVNGKPYLVEQRQVLAVPSYGVHFFQTERYSDTFVLAIPLDFIPSFQKTLSKKTFATALLEEGPAAREIARCMRVLARRRSQSVPISVVRGYIYIVLGLLLDNLPLQDISQKAHHTQIRSILDYLHENYLLPLSLESLAAHFGYSKSRFSHIFNESIGCSISEYVNTLRCRNAANLLTEGSMPMIDAAMSSGFESMRTFYRSFKKCFGLTPTEYLAASGDSEANY